MTGLIPFTPVISDAAAIGAGAVCGALCRHHIGKAASERIAKDPSLKYLSGWHTAGINVLGSFVLGGVFGSPLIDPTAASASSAAPTTNTNPAKFASSTMTTPKKAAPLSSSASSMMGLGLTPRMKLMLGVGFCGSFTTASTMNLDVANMIGRGEMMKAASYVMMNNVGGVCAAAAGMMLAKKLFLFRL